MAQRECGERISWWWSEGKWHHGLVYLGTCPFRLFDKDRYYAYLTAPPIIGYCDRCAKREGIAW